MLPKDLIAASMRPLVLTLLSEREGYGYDLIQRIRAHSSAQLEWTEGTLYPVLHRLEKEGLVRAVWQRAETDGAENITSLRQSGVLHSTPRNRTG